MHVVKNAGEIAGAEHTIRRLEGGALGDRTIIPAEIRHHTNPPVGIDRCRKIPSVQDSVPIAGSGIGREWEPGAHERVAGEYLDLGVSCACAISPGANKTINTADNLCMVSPFANCGTLTFLYSRAPIRALQQLPRSSAECRHLNAPRS